MFLRDANNGGGHFGVLTRFARDWAGTVGLFRFYLTCAGLITARRVLRISPAATLLSGRYFPAIRLREPLQKQEMKRK